MSCYNYLKQTNKVCSPLFATFIPIRIDRLSDIFLPISTHCVKKLSSSGIGGRIWNAVRTSGALLTDITSLPFRLITFVPRFISEMFRLPLIKLSHPVKDLAEVDDDENPCIISSDKEKFYFSLSPMHESEAKEYFDKRVPALFNTTLNPKAVIYFPGDNCKRVRIPDIPDNPVHPQPSSIYGNPVKESRAIEFFDRINATLNASYLLTHKKEVDSPPELTCKNPSLQEALDRIRLAVQKPINSSHFFT